MLQLILSPALSQVGDSLEEFLLAATPDAKLRQCLMSLSEATRTIAFKVRGILSSLAFSQPSYSVTAPWRAPHLPKQESQRSPFRGLTLDAAVRGRCARPPVEPQRV